MQYTAKIARNILIILVLGSLHSNFKTIYPEFSKYHPFVTDMCIVQLG